MAGKAYNPRGFEPDAHERYLSPPEEVMETYRKSSILERWHQPVTYHQIQEYRRRGESHALGHYAYEMMYDIYAGIEDKLLEGAIDAHLHIYPDYVPRSIDIIDLAIDASRAKMHAIVCKDHFFTNVGQAWAAQRVVEEMVRRGELEHACQVFGTHILAWSHHPDQVHLIRKYPNLGAIFFYTMTGHGQAGPDLPIVDDNGELLPEVKDCIAAAAEYRICVMTGHKEYELVKPMVEFCHEVGARVLITHAGGGPYQPSFAGTVEQAKELAELGAYLEINANKWLPNMMWPLLDPNEIMDYIRAVGPEHCVADTDFGQVLVGHPVEGLRLFIRGMLHFGISEQEIKTMIQTNPARVLYLED